MSCTSLFLTLKAKNVLWLYYENDLFTLQSEMNSSILRRYLIEKDYSQNLIFRQDEIDNVLINYVQNELDKQEKNWDKENTGLADNAIKILKKAKELAGKEDLDRSKFESPQEATKWINLVFQTEKNWLKSSPCTQSNPCQLPFYEYFCGI